MKPIKYAAYVVAPVLVFSLAACGGSDEKTKGNNNDQAAAVASLPEDLPCSELLNVDLRALLPAVDPEGSDIGGTAINGCDFEGGAFEGDDDERDWLQVRLLTGAPATLDAFKTANNVQLNTDASTPQWNTVFNPIKADGWTYGFLTTADGFDGVLQDGSIALYLVGDNGKALSCAWHAELAADEDLKYEEGGTDFPPNRQKALEAQQDDVVSVCTALLEAARSVKS